ncbi:MAG: hypothetical protein IJP02_02090 [Oscillospiraceae bacterium]|nr:hypothetical protein [Oscillospiraceae bacterium]
MLGFLKQNAAPTTRRTVTFGGLDRRAGAGEGRFAQMENLSSRRYPYLSPTRADKVETFTDAESIFYWDGVRIVAAGGRLWYGEEALCNLTPGKKQFAVLNTQLVVWPDAITVDLTNKRVEPMRATAVNRGTAIFTAQSLILDPEPRYAQTGHTFKSYDSTVPYLWTYASAAWDETGGWTLEGGAWLPADACKGRCYIPEVSYSDSTDHYSAHTPTNRYAAKTPEGEGQPGNDLGFYGRVDRVTDYSRTASSYTCTLSCTLYWAQQAGQSVAGLFRAGDVVSVSGTPCGVRDVEKAIVRSVEAKTNALVFDAGTFRAGQAVGQLSEDISDTLYVRWTKGENTYRYKAGGVTGQAGWYVIVDGQTLRLYDPDWQQQASYTATSVSSVAGLEVTQLQPMDEFTTAVTVSRPVPDLDHICQQDNRLWGVCSADNGIYASALGDPCSFYRYDGLSTDSYTVAVGSEGDFTGICSFGGSVLCFKENAMHKVLGTLPENYHLTTCTMAGVARDSGASLVCVGDTLYYLSPDGVYTTTGGLPRCISHPLGPEPMTGGVGGTDGKCYYLSVQRGQESELLVYDTALGLWYRRDASRPTAMARSPQGLVCLEGDRLRTLEAGSDPVEWQGELAPMYEDMERVQYSRIALRACVEPGSRVWVEASYDDGPWQRLGLVRGAGHRVARLELPLRRCAVLRLRLGGVGDCTLLELQRQYRKRGRG